MKSTPVSDPCTGEVVRPLRPPSRDELAATADGLRSAQSAWEAAGPEPRAEALRGWRDRIAAARGDVVEALVADTGRRGESELEVDLVLGMLDRWARIGPDLLAAPAEEASSIPGIVLRGDSCAYPLLGVISPWNFPLLLGLIDAVPALLAGCAVLVKPSEVTPRFIEPLAATIGSDLPLRIVEGAGDVGAALVEEVDAVAFTGSVPTGRTVAEAAARAFIPAFLEMGGKDPAIVLAGADLDRASSAVLWGGTANAGQSCLSIERVYVQREAYEEFTELLVAKAARSTFTRDGGPIGPLIDPEQATVIERHLADAAARGATARTGGVVERHDGGLWCPPTVLTGVDHTMAVMTEETFGPVLPVMAVADADAAVRLADDTSYGLSAAVFAGTEADALALAARLRVGAVSVNDAALTAIISEGEKNAFKLSGLGGSRMGAAALRRFLRRRSYLVNRRTDADPWWH